MKIYKNIAFLFIIVLSACSKDLGNYDYHDINELSIKGVNSTYLVRTGIDTLRITPTLDASLDKSDLSRYDFRWILKEGPRDFDTLSREKDLSYPVKLNVAMYDLFYRVTDKETGVTWVANTKIDVSTAYSKGLLIMGENEDGYADIEMLSMLNDTVHVKNILGNSDLPPLSDPVSLVHTGGAADYIRLWAMTKTGSYFLDRSTMNTTTSNTLSRIVYMSEDIDPATLHPIVIAPQINNKKGDNGNKGNSLYRALITAGGDIFASIPLFMAGDFYNNPVNRVADGPGTLLQAAPYLLYPIQSMSNFIWYDLNNQRFLSFTSIGTGTTSTVRTDGPNDIFPWNQPAGRSLIYAENTRNTDGGSTNGNSFAIMKNADNTCLIYKFYANGTNPAKRGAYEVKSIATDFHKADHYAFSSNRSVVFYSVGNMLYAYDYNSGFEKIYEFPEISDEITMIKFDTQIDHVVNSLYIATYNNSTKGTLQRFRVGTNPNVVELLPQANSSWSNMVKIKDINWRAVN